jgi:hypothetical protein
MVDEAELTEAADLRQDLPDQDLEELTGPCHDLPDEDLQELTEGKICPINHTARVSLMPDSASRATHTTYESNDSNYSVRYEALRRRDFDTYEDYIAAHNARINAKREETGDVGGPRLGHEYEDCGYRKHGETWKMVDGEWRMVECNKNGELWKMVDGELRMVDDGWSMVNGKWQKVQLGVVPSRPSVDRSKRKDLDPFWSFLPDIFRLKP